MARDLVVIAEIGVNHDGSLSKALDLVDVAVDAGADAAKFQTFDAHRLASVHTPKVPYQERDTSSSSHLQMLERLQLSNGDHRAVADHCNKRGIEFMSTPYGVEDARFLVELGVRTFKTASADVIDIPLHEYLASTGVPVIASTGMADRAEIEEMIAVYPQQEGILTLLHTTSEYPTPIENCNLSRLEALKEFGLPVGYSDHTEGPWAAVMAVALGARVVERHITLDRSDPGPDHFASDDPVEFADYVAAVRDAARRRGSAQFRPTDGEKAMRATSRKSLHLVRSLPAGTVLSEADLELRRPGSGLLWRDRDRIVGRPLISDRQAGEMLTEADVSM